MYEAHHACEAPEDASCRIWRYLDLAKYMSLLERRSLWFSSLKTLGDEFEGEKPRSALMPFRITSDQDRVKVREGYQRESALTRAMMTVNCWSIGPDESAGLWNQYCAGPYGVAVTSSFSRLKTSFRETETMVYIGKVTYIDYETDGVPGTNLFYLCTRKRLGYAYENELRAIVMDTEGKPGLYVPTDLGELVEGIRVSPKAPQWFREDVEATSRRYGLDVPVLESALDTKPPRHDAV